MKWKVTRGRAFQEKKTHTKAWRQERIGPFRALHMALCGWRGRFLGRGGGAAAELAVKSLVCHAKE